jgi:lipopolysaccharide export system protein LptA
MKPHYQMLKIQMRRLGLALMLPAALWSAIALPTQTQSATAQTSQNSQQNRPLYIRGKVQEFNSKTQVATVRGNVELVYPARGIQATAAQAQYFARERQIILSGNVYVLQQG